MSNIYIQEPPTNGKVLLITSVGDIDVELWSKEAPKACRNFVQLCMEGYYNGTIFHRMVPNFIVQGGDPTGSGHGGESIYGKPFQDEFHSRLRFVRRGLVAMANAGPHDNGSQFFFTLAATAELNSKHTIFGKVGGNTIYNMIKLGEGETDHDERPLYPHKIIRTEIISNPFEDIIPRVRKTKSEEHQSKRPEVKATKNFKLLSFGEEAEEEEREATEVAQSLRTKGKSSHDLLNDAKLSSVPAVDEFNERETIRCDEDDSGEKDYQGRNVDKTGMIAETVRNKLKRHKDDDHYKKKEKHKRNNKDDDQRKYAVEVNEYDNLNQPEEMKSSKLSELKAESQRLKMELIASRHKKKDSVTTDTVEDVKSDVDNPDLTANDEISAFMAERHKYKEQNKKQSKKGSDREAETLKMLAAFQSRIGSAKKLSQLVTGDDEASDEGNEEEDDASDLSWIRHELHFENSDRKVLDANVHDVDRYTVYDPRNPLTQRRREASEQAMKQKKQKR